MKRLFLIDAYALIYRCYYAFLGRPMRNAAGMNTSAIFGFVKYIRDIIKRESPQYLGVAFDSKGPTFRHEMYPQYKANRDATPEDIHASIPYIKNVLEAMRIPILEMQGWEADDIIGTLSCKAEQEEFEVYMVTPDKDYGQLVRPQVFIYKQLKGGEGIEVVGPEKIKQQYGIDDPKLIIDILALWGDASDNIPGVMGIGEKGAVKLVNQFGTVENILDNCDKLTGRQKENICASREQLLLSKKLATIDTQAPVDFVPDKLVMERPDIEALRVIYKELGFNMFLRELETGEFFAKVDEPLLPDQENGPKQAKQTQLAKVAAEKSRLKAEAALKGQGSLFGEVNQAGSVNTVGENYHNDEGFTTESYDCISTIDHKYHVVRTADEIKQMVEIISTQSEFCFDTETTGFDVFNDRLVGVSFSIKRHEAWYVPFDRNNTAENIELLRPLFENENIAKIGQNIKFDIMMLAANGIRTRGFKYDTMIMHYLLDPESRHGMNHLCRSYLGYEPIEIQTLIGKGSKQITMDMVPVDKVGEYSCEDADVTCRLKEILWPQIIEQGLEELYRTVEEPMIDVLADIEMTGVKIDSYILSQSGEELNRTLALLEERIRIAADEPSLNVNSSRQLGEALFAKLKIDSKPKMTKTKQFRTDEEYLQSLADRNPIIGLILEYRGIKKLLSTYIEALPQLVNPKTGRIHTSYNQAVTATGRLSSSNPNLQNIPIRDDQGREIRKAFVATDDNYLIFSADYSQVELRLMAHLSGDSNLLEAFNQKEDIHASTASKLFGVPLEEVTADQRRKAKTANFGIIYGISAFGLSQRLNIPRGEAREIIDGYFRAYPQVKEYMDRVIEDAKGDGYVKTIFGRKRWLNDINSANAVARGLAERNAINAPIQGSAADIMKLAMINVHRQFIEAGLKSKVIMQVHDELVVDMLRSEEDQVKEIVIGAMENAAKLKIELTVDYGIGNNWVEAH